MPQHKTEVPRLKLDPISANPEHVSNPSTQEPSHLPLQQGAEPRDRTRGGCTGRHATLRRALQPPARGGPEFGNFITLVIANDLSRRLNRQRS